MEIRNCKKCGRIYNYFVGPNLCPRCMQEQEEKFQSVKQYIYDNPGAGVAEVAEAMDVTVAQIRQWVREERLEFAEGSITDIVCESCGKTILSGRYCSQCKEAMVRNLGSIYHSDTKKQVKEGSGKAKMRFLK